MAQIVFRRAYLIGTGAEEQQWLELPPGGRVPVAGETVYLPDEDGQGGDEAFRVLSVAHDLNPDPVAVAHVMVTRG